MKKIALILVFSAVAISSSWLIWLQSAGEEAVQTNLVTKVAVHVGQISRTTLRGYVTAYGTVEPEPVGERPAASARLAPAVPGIITDVNCAEGDHVATGDVLFQLDSRAVDVAVESAKQVLERQKKLARVEGTSQKALQEAEARLNAARVQQAYLRVSSPLAGTVTHVNGKPGEAVDLTSVLAEVVDLDRLVVSAGVPSAELASLRVGRPAEVFADRAASVIAGRLTFVGTEVAPSTGTALTRSALPADSGLRPGQFVKIRIVSAEHKNCLAVPVESVVRNAEGAPVIAVVQDDTAVQIPVQTGLREGGLVEVEAEGLQPGMSVVTEGAYGLPQETKVRVLN